MNQLGITGMMLEHDDWLYRMTEPLAQLLALLYQGNVLAAPDRALVFSLLGQVTPDQAVGVGDTRPQGSTATATDGWLIGTDDLWAMNPSGSVTTGVETWIISVFSAQLNSLSVGQNIARQVCTRVASLLQEHKGTRDIFLLESRSPRTRWYD